MTFAFSGGRGGASCLRSMMAHGVCGEPVAAGALRFAAGDRIPLARATVAAYAGRGAFGDVYRVDLSPFLAASSFIGPLRAAERPIQTAGPAGACGR